MSVNHTGTEQQVQFRGEEVYPQQHHEEMIEEVDDDLILLGSGEYQLVGIRYYRGVAHPGEFVRLVREPNNPYDRNAIRVDNCNGAKVGHVKREAAAKIAPLMDSLLTSLYLEASIPRPGNYYTLPLEINFYSHYLSFNAAAAADDDATAQAKRLFDVLNTSLHNDYNFRFAPMFGGGRASASNNVASVQPQVQIQKVDWKVQAKELDDMFEKQCDNQLKNLPDIEVPLQLKNVTLFRHQIEGIQWLVEREKQVALGCNGDGTVPFFKQVSEGAQNKWLCDITQCSQLAPPSPVSGSLLADEMGLGKTIQTICLILLSPPTGHEYPDGIDGSTSASAESNSTSPSDNKEDDCEAQIPEIPIPPENKIRSQKATVLKSILKSAGVKQSGKKSDLIDRILQNIECGIIKGEHFPMALTIPARTQTVSSSCGICTLIVCPVSVMSNWQQQIDEHVREKVLSLELYHGGNRQDLLPHLLNSDIDILLVSYHTLSAEYTSVYGKVSNSAGGKPVGKKQKKSSISEIKFHGIVLDEAHIIRNENTTYSKAVKEIKADRKLALTGTPFVNKSDDIYSLFSFLNVEPLNKKDIFRRAISQKMKEGSELGLTRLRTAISYIALRRSKGKVGLKLAEKEVQLRSISFNDDDGHGRVYKALFGTFRTAMSAVLNNGNDPNILKNYSSVFEKILRMRQSCCSALLVSESRRKIALDVWEELQKRDTDKKLTKDEGLALLEKLQGTFTQTDDDSELPECAVCLMEMEEEDSCILRTCKHVFCSLCLGNVLNMSNQKCPLCRTPFTKGDMINKKHACKAASQGTASTEKTWDKNEFGPPPKIVALLNAIEEMKADEKGVIFSQFTSFLNVIGAALKNAGHDYVRIDGSMNPRKRIESVQSFSSNDEGSPRFILCSLRAAGTGINLTRGNYAFMMDCWWNESVESQAMDRIHRIGQSRKVTVIKFVMKDSIEERMVALQKVKSVQAKGAMEKLSAEEKRMARVNQLRGLLLLEDEE